MRLLHLADVHLDAPYSPFGAAAADRRNAVLDAFRNLPAAAHEHGVDAVLVAGDLFDGPDPSDVSRAAAAEVFAKLRAADRPVFVVPGNHDSNLFQPNPYRDDLGGALVLLAPTFGSPHTATTAAGLLNVYGLSYDPAASEEPLAGFRRADADGVHVVLLHGPVHGSPHWGVSANSLRLLPEDLSNFDVDYIALGDFHRFRQFPQAPACYSGSFAALDLTESGPRGFVVVDVEPGGPPTARLVPSGVPPVIELGRIDVSDVETMLDVVTAITERLPEENVVPLAVLEGVPRFPLDGKAIQDVLIQRYGHARLVDDTRYVTSERLDELAQQDTVAAHVVRLARDRIAETDDERQRRIADRALRIALRQLGID